MIYEMDRLLQHWADEFDRPAYTRQPASMLAQAIEFGGLPPRTNGPKFSSTPWNDDLSDLAWDTDVALSELGGRHRQMAFEHYRDGGYSEAKCERLEIGKRAYYKRIDSLHVALQRHLAEKAKRRRSA
ncbi:hypothetical protein QO259_05575 [Salinicola sp. JS01]|uniref:hypothetical protein n=1 Tax=Salinicola sp. JS01 TaxID=3050071 RepID=UPI0004E6ADB3|nr:hypothetical protein [Salinicola sp. JS01]KFF50469.1 hypothetical protein GY26_01920 [Gammaproteobacteria bacterium MFB021]WIX34132.1 hypothetical protein QO259_05575 [Salinicola sp. JS01]